MKFLLLSFFAVAALSAQAREYRVYQVEVTNGVEWTPPTQNMRASIENREGVILRRFAILRSIRRGTYVADYTYEIKFAEQFDRNGTPIEAETREVGLKVQLVEGEYGAQVDYYAADLERWEITGIGEPPLIEPVLDTFSLDAKVDFKDENFAMIGGLSQGSSNCLCRLRAY